MSVARPLYETAENLSSERDVLALLQRRWGYRPAKLPIKYQLDYGLYQGRDLRALLEVKCRKYTVEQLDRMGGFFLSFDKWMAAEVMCRLCDVPFKLVVSFNGDVRVATFNYPFPLVAPVEGGRKDRGDWQDIEPVVQFRGTQFEALT